MHITQGVHCAACYGQYPDRECVDFDAAYDGPVLEGESHKITIDDLVICKDCLRAAAIKLGWTPDSDGSKREGALRAELDQAESALRQTQRALDAQIDATAEIEKAKWPGGRPAVTRTAEDKARRAAGRARVAAERKAPPGA